MKHNFEFDQASLFAELEPIEQVEHFEPEKPEQSLPAGHFAMALDGYAKLQMDASLPDGKARWQAVDPTRSFIVQAPAGSGKTSLLSQRFLALLSRVAKPEQIVAMTFTKKAAAEMRRRVLEMLAFGLEPLPEKADLVTQNNWHLAQAALAQDAQQNWQLLTNPNRLRIKTIDGVNSFLVGQMPLLSKLGASSQISQTPSAAYQKAVRNCLRDESVQAEVADLLALVNGRIRTVESLLSSMLQKRDQWMSSVLTLGALNAGSSSHEYAQQIRAYLQQGLSVLVEEEFAQQRAILQYNSDEFAQICRIAAYSQHKEQPQLSAIAEAWPFAADTAVQQWQVLSTWILTADDKGVRKPKGLNKNCGFPPEKGEEKQWKILMGETLESLAAEIERKPEILEALKVLKGLPKGEYSEQQWQSLRSIVVILRQLVLHLKVVFQETGEVDFIEVAQAAARSLGSELEPTDLAQQLDYQIQHLLIDEFQDTSTEQFRLLQKLVAGWQTAENFDEGDGRTLFIVGDPMQSIYRFREAEVGNFLKAWQGKIGEVRLIPLNLLVNFRSTQGVVDWVNEAFSAILPQENRMTKGAVKYSQSLAYSKDAAEAVTEHFALDRTTYQEAQEVVDVIRAYRETLPAGEKVPTIAVLGRNRSHLASIAGLLKEKQVPFRAVELESLQERQEVQDVLALTRAFLHQGDRAAWIALLRSPMMGLNLPELQSLIGDKPYATVWQVLEHRLGSDAAVAELSLSESQVQRLQLLMKLMQQAWASQGYVGFAQLIRELWWALDGPVSLGGSAFDHASGAKGSVLDSDSQIALDNVEVFLQALEQQQSNSDGIQSSLWTVDALDELLQSLFAKPDMSEHSRNIELMTMHKSKGLEFDVVILPGLHRKPRGDEQGLLNWFEFSSQSAEFLVMSPLDPRGEDKSALTQMLRRFEQEKSNYEIGRLFYVAATRAKKRLHLFASAKVTEDKKNAEWTLAKPAQGSLLSSFWPLAENTFVRLLKDFDPQETLSRSDEVWLPKVKRLPQTYRSFALWQQLNSQSPSSLRSTNLTSAHLSTNSSVLQDGLEREGEVARTGDNWFAESIQFSNAVGKLVHAILEQLVNVQFSSPEMTQALESGEVEKILIDLQSRQTAFASYLLQQGVKSQQLQAASDLLWQSLQNTLHHPQARWSLLASHADSRTEWSLHSKDDTGLFEQHFVDRSFVDEQGGRWIIDYKTSHSLGDGVALTAANIDKFVAAQTEVYRAQLNRYAELIAKLENRSQQKVLYFTYLNRWVVL